MTNPSAAFSPAVSDASLSVASAASAASADASFPTNAAAGLPTPAASPAPMPATTPTPRRSTKRSLKPLRQALYLSACKPEGLLMYARRILEDILAMAMKTTYFEDDDTLVIRLSDKPVVREVSQDWNTHDSYAADGTVVETVILDAARCSAWPLSLEHRAAA